MLPYISPAALLKSKTSGTISGLSPGEPSTTWHCMYYDETSNKLRGQSGSPLKIPGDFFEYCEGAGGVASISGVSFWNADKPFMVMQYSYSHEWDGATEWSPVMIQLNPMEQYVDQVAFVSSNDFPAELNLFALGDPNDKASTLLKSIMLDGVPFTTKSPQIVYNQIPGTTIYWAKCQVDPGCHTLESHTLLAGYIARERPGCMGWYIGMNLNKIDETDTVPPVIAHKSAVAGSFALEATERTVGKPQDSPQQKDQGISKVVFLSEISENFAPTVPDFKPQLGVYILDFSFDVIDPDKPAKAYFALLDRAGNIRIDSVKFFPDV